MLGLRRGHRDMPFAREPFLFGSRSGTESAGATVIADTVCAHVVDDCPRIRVVDDRAIHVHDRGVVVEVVASPVSALEACANVAESVIHTTVESDICSPVTSVPGERTVVPAPVSGSPEDANFRCLHPGSRDPVIVAILGVPGPIAGRPKITIAGTDRLGVNRQNRRCNRDRHSDTLREGKARASQHGKYQ